MNVEPLGGYCISYGMTNHKVKIDLHRIWRGDTPWQSVESAEWSDLRKRTLAHWCVWHIYHKSLVLTWELCKETQPGSSHFISNSHYQGLSIRHHPATICTHLVEHMPLNICHSWLDQFQRRACGDSKLEAIMTRLSIEQTIHVRLATYILRPSCERFP